MTYAAVSPSASANAARVAGTASGTARFDTTASTRAWCVLASSEAISAATRTCSGVRPLLEMTRTIGASRLAAMRAL